MNFGKLFGILKRYLKDHIFNRKFKCVFKFNGNLIKCGSNSRADWALLP